MLDELFQALSALFPSLNNLLNPGESSGEVPVSMSEEIIIQAVYIAIEPFFVVDSSDTAKENKSSAKNKKDGIITRTLNKTPMRGLRLDALALIRSVCLSCSALFSETTSDIRPPRIATILDNRRDPLFPDKAVFCKPKGWTVPLA